MSMSRRRFLKISTVASYAILGGVIGGFGSSRLYANEVKNDYKALVCIFLYGGMDNHDTLIPYDTSEYNKYKAIREPLLNDYGVNRDQASLLPLQVKNNSDFGSREFALPKEMSGLQKLFNERKASIVANVGPLVQPISKDKFTEEMSSVIPKRLFSHNDQQTTWLANSPEGAKLGWGGSFMDTLRGLNGSSDFESITANTGRVFLSGKDSSPYQVDIYGDLKYYIFDDMEESSFKDNMIKHLKSQTYSGNKIFAKDVASNNKNSYELNEKFNKSIQSIGETTTTFPEENELASELKAVAKTLAIKDSLDVNRQIFFVAQHGYDTHDNQATNLPKLQKNLDEAISAFYSELEVLGLEDSITLFTASEFGRTLSVNGDGTDHGWGGHHFVIGGAVDGGKIFGDVPNAGLNHEFDVGDGRLLPTTSVEQFAKPLGKWMGMTENELLGALPGLNNFSKEINYLKT